MFKKVLIANRGEIALRIIRACKDMGIHTVAVYSEIDEDSVHVHFADESICIGPGPSKKSYLNIDSIITAALVTKCEAIHPGYGFLSENSKFVEACIANDIKFIGPSAHHMEKMGNKSEARRTMIEAGVPVVPGSPGSTNNAEEAFEVAKEIGFPVIIKAASGGGGRGMRIVYLENEFIEKFNMAKSESAVAFNDDSMYVEKFVEEPRHIEFQILADEYGNVIHLGERDCSIQRKNQKVLEEAPCTIMSQELRNKMGEMAVRAAKAVNYVNAGTIEFLLDKHNNFYFIEMNTRIQVEHPVTEMTTGIDLIKEQIKVAYGERLSVTSEELTINGHSIECRINAEDPSENFRPSPGLIEVYFPPGGYGVRIDSHIYSGYVIPPTYDSMIGKLIVWGKDRTEAIDRMKRALSELVITGVDTNIEFQREILSNEKFVENKIDTSFIEKEILKG
ncbi:acetyl-CoA carboxylase biotin carboxylase subunit [Serpentinicella alkaliphila]|uniref:Biotin carboxylase n=1 Tax=Serpentinicella alkaliphila TaxID=1734049 RepID=A0A4R2TWE9_9FIRM|nr:acetyl-CoA carboxylase biotin carboxylase subunit [Serpentinicella alkaliphila]QUH25884.1 acetyl-CoA carboxylase biotin carboxylase subunit [Serpentinicella alkaliphila]TCQ01949.1 acetyl-CoA carboxylase biotin carboxylase subunit [Serpentinicella alkaliphila]